MWEMFKNSATLFMRGKLFRDNSSVAKQCLKVFGAVLLLLVALSYVVPLWAAVCVAGAVGGALQPVLFKDLKYN